MSYKRDDPSFNAIRQAARERVVAVSRCLEVLVPEASPRQRKRLANRILTLADGKDRSVRITQEQAQQLILPHLQCIAKSCPQLCFTLRGDDIVAEPMSIVIEARDRGSRPMGRKAISTDMAVKIAQRNANAGIYVSRTLDGLSAREIGEWAEGACDYGPWVACTQQHLTTAVRFLIVQRRVASLRAVSPEVDSASIEQQVEAIRTLNDSSLTFRKSTDSTREAPKYLQVLLTVGS